MMQTYNKSKMDGFWMYCFTCYRKGLSAYAYTPKDAREHNRDVHGETQEYVNKAWPDNEMKKE